MTQRDVLNSKFARLKLDNQYEKLMQEIKDSAMTVQSLLFPKGKFNRSQAIRWASNHGFKSSKVDETDNFFRLRQKNPKMFDTYKTKKFPKTGGIKAIVAKNQEKSKMKTMYKLPEAARNNARKVLEWKKKYGSKVKGMTSVGWARARQLANNTHVNLQTVKAMSGFNRHKKNAKIDNPKYKSEPWRDPGKTSWLGWGGSVGVNWARGITGALSKTSKFTGKLNIPMVSKFSNGIRSEMEIPIPMPVELWILSSGPNRDGFIPEDEIEMCVDYWDRIPIIDFHDMADMLNLTAYKQSDVKGVLGKAQVGYDATMPDKKWIVAPGLIHDRNIAYQLYLNQLKGKPLEVSAEFRRSTVTINGVKLIRNIRPYLVVIVKEGHIQGNSITIKDMDFSLSEREAMLEILS